MGWPPFTQIPGSAPGRFWAGKNRAHSACCLEFVKDVPNQGLVCFVGYSRFVCLCFVFVVYVVFCFLVFVVSTSAIDCLERLVSEMTYYV